MPCQNNKISRNLIFITRLDRQMSPNVQLSWIKSFYRAKQKQFFSDKVQNCKFIFDFVTGGLRELPTEANVNKLLPF